MQANHHLAIMSNPTQTGDQTKQERFTVKSQPRINIIKEQIKKEQKETSIGLAVVKWISTILMFFITLTCLVGSKVTLISIAGSLNPSNIKSNNNASIKSNNIAGQTKSDVAFVMVILIIVIPNFFSLLKTLWTWAFSGSESWPSSKSIVFGIIGSVLEVCGLCIFTLILIPTSRNFSHSVLFMNGIFILPICFEFGKIIYGFCKRDLNNDINEDHSYRAYSSERNQRNKEKERRSKILTSLRLILAGLLAIGGLAYIIVETDSWYNRIAAPIFMILISIAWSPKMFKLQSQPRRLRDDTNLEEDEIDDLAENIRIKSSRNRITLITSLLKIVLVFLVAMMINYFLRVSNNKDPKKTFKNGFDNFLKYDKLYSLFFIQIFTSFLGYVMCRLACTMNLQKVCFVVPLLLSTPLAVLVSVTQVCKTFDLINCYNESQDENLKEYGFLVLGALLWTSQILSYSFEFWKSQQFLMAAEEVLFWLPIYNGCLLEQFLLLNRKNEITDEYFVNYHDIVKNSNIYICTTMYHEADYEMEQLLTSLSSVDTARKECGRQFEAHIFFDDGARGEVVKLYALQLLSLVKETMGIDPAKAFKLETPYGLQMKWALPNGMPFVIHLKDKHKVKAKKRWSQVMYMSYVLDFKQDRSKDDLTYILATDADVRFTPKDVMALMDLMSRSPKVGAVCGRTHPLGSGPMVWYQIFDYAIGHWLLKVANHVCGSVLCSPGCFSVYRARAIRDVLPLYSSGVDCAMDFLMKDMGEDRWFCTLLVEAGWKLEYCATSEDSTYCPETFDEFFKQRRRWGPSTFANSLVVIDKQSELRKNNDAISFPFIVYQMVLMLSSIIGPSTVLLVIAGGLQYAYPYTVNMVSLLVILVLISVAFTLVCLYCSQDTQLKIAKILTFIFAIVMSIAFVGIILQTVKDVGNYISPPLKPTLTPPPKWMNATTAAPEYEKRKEILFDPPTWYLFLITSIFVMTAILHGFEGIYLIHGIWYLLCLPSGYLLLTIYSVANLTDRSWGTREGKTAVEQSDASTFETISRYFKYFCWCCVPPHLREQPENKGGMNKDSEEKKDEVEENEESDEHNETDEQKNVEETPKEEAPDTVPKVPKSAMKNTALKRYPSSELLDEREKFGKKKERKKKREPGSFRFPGEKTVKFSAKLPKMNAATLVSQWLPEEYQMYVSNFKDHGYDSVAFIAGNIKEKDLINIGIDNRGHRKRIMFFIERLAPEDMLQDVPDNVEEWLIKLGLEEYWPSFHKNGYGEPRDLADIKHMNRDTVSSLFGITKEGHLKRLLMATSVLQYPTRAQIRIRETRKAVMAEPVKKLETDNADDGAEHEFWNKLKEICLLPEQEAFNKSGEMKAKLADLRDTCLLVLAVSNVLWLTFMVAIMDQGDSLSVFNSSFASVAFLFIYSLVLIFQFFSLLWHRLESAIHFLARAPFKPGHLKSNWAWRDDDLPPLPSQELLDEIRVRRRKRSRVESTSSNVSDDINKPLLGGKSISFAGNQMA